MRFVEVVKHYPGQQQVNLSVEIEVPGSWFGGTEMGSLSASERRQKYKAQAVEYAEVREFPGASVRARKVKEPAIRFICLDDASSDPNSDGYWMQLSQWNRFRHDTFKERPDDEIPFILGTGPSSVLAAELDSSGATANRCRAARSNKSSRSSVRVFTCRKTRRKSRVSIGPARRRTASCRGSRSRKCARVPASSSATLGPVTRPCGASSGSHLSTVRHFRMMKGRR